jgi:glycosyltransferase involved in cell wall biosynthesis
MRELARRHDVSVLSLVDPDELDGEQRVHATRGYCRDVWTIPQSGHVAGGMRKRGIQAGSLLSPYSFERLAYECPALRHALKDLLARESFDLIQFEFVHMALGCRSPCDGTPLLLDEHNVEYDILRRTAAQEGSLARRLYNGANWRKLRAEEQQVWRRFDGCTLTSERDRRLLADDAPGLPARVVPNGVDTNDFTPEPQGAVDEETVLFFGAMNYYPNSEGVLFFLRQVLPKLKLARPGVRFRIVGQRPPQEITTFCDPAVEIVGYVDDIRKEIARAAAVVVPLRIGGGTRLKILEAMAMGKAIVSTPIGAEGIDLVDGRDVLLGADEDALALHLVRVLESRDLARRLGGAALDLARSRYSWRASAGRLSEFHAELAERRRAA